MAKRSKRRNRLNKSKLRNRVPEFSYVWQNLTSTVIANGKEARVFTLHAHSTFETLVDDVMKDGKLVNIRTMMMEIRSNSTSRYSITPVLVKLDKDEGNIAADVDIGVPTYGSYTIQNFLAGQLTGSFLCKPLTTVQCQSSLITPSDDGEIFMARQRINLTSSVQKWLQQYQAQKARDKDSEPYDLQLVLFVNSASGVGGTVYFDCLLRTDYDIVQGPGRSL